MKRAVLGSAAQTEMIRHGSGESRISPLLDSARLSEGRRGMNVVLTSEPFDAEKPADTTGHSTGIVPGAAALRSYTNAQWTGGSTSRTLLLPQDQLDHRGVHCFSS